LFVGQQQKQQYENWTIYMVVGVVSIRKKKKRLKRGSEDEGV